MTAAPDGGSACGYAKTCSPRVAGRQRYARATTASSPGPGTLRLPRSGWRGPLPIQPLPGDTKFAQTMPEPGRQHQYMGAAPNPRILTGWSGASSDGLRFPARAFLRFPVCPPGLFPFVRLPPVSLRPALSGSVPSAVAVRFGSPPVSLRVPFPLSNPHGSAAARAVLRALVPRGRDQGHQFPGAIPGSIAPVRPRRRCSPGADRVARRGGPVASLPALRIS